MNKEEFKLQKEFEKIRHKNKMEEIQFELDCKMKTEEIKSSHDKELLRIKSAEIRRSQERKIGYGRTN